MAERAKSRTQTSKAKGKGKGAPVAPSASKLKNTVIDNKKGAPKKKGAAPKTLLDKAVVAIKAHREYNGTSRTALSKYIKNEFGNDNKAALAAALKKGVAGGVLAQQRQSFTVVADHGLYEKPAEGASSDQDDEPFIPRQFEKSAHSELIVELSYKKEGGALRVPVSKSQWAEWLSDPDCEGAEYGLSSDNTIGADKSDGCWMHDNWGGGYYSSGGDEECESGELADCMDDCPDCHLGKKMLRYIEKGVGRGKFQKA